MSARGHRILSLAAGTLLLAAHLLPWRTDLPPRFGWMPRELVLRLAWMAAALVFLLHFCARVWRASGDESDA